MGGGRLLHPAPIKKKGEKEKHSKNWKTEKNLLLQMLNISVIWGWGKDNIVHSC